MQASANNSYSMCLTNEGDIFAWGRGEYLKIDKDELPSLMESVIPKRLHIYVERKNE